MKKLALSILAAAVTVPLSAMTAEAKTKACFVYVGSVSDLGWTYQHHQGMLEMQKALGDQVETAFVENVPEGADAERAIERSARVGCNIIFATSFGYMDAVNRVAAKFPDVKFEHASGYKREHSNVSTYNSRPYDGRYIEGVIAAKLSKNGSAGYITSFPVPAVIMGINAFMLGAQSVNPDFKIKIVWTNSWFDPGKEADAAKALIDQDQDILVQHTDSTGPMLVAAERGIKAFGQSSDMIKFGPKTQLSAVIENWGPYYTERVKAVIDGNWKQSDVWGGMAKGFVVMAPYTNMPDDVKKRAEEVEEKIRSGAFEPFTGPVFKQDSSVWLAAGRVAQAADVLGMDFYVKGVDDKLPL
ncbi:BMP family ABC transporter substrate-binding protein [Pararhizobium sp. YC-54]|uniref:BMP family ABC transporter substrate-binding protein n=1 Tax=Pararhizobium sp. YC-54 TaxID=2986920 RepID=UPI0021F716A9|nr:BMP family ABC transporter substrate-binding protein [Pararhizobium sp. YC-54]MCW0000104.1 BMP family ABC transporter substrate-binding protein [Pararhizobium sp. YC-54]